MKPEPRAVEVSPIAQTPKCALCHTGFHPPDDMKMLECGKLYEFPQQQVTVHYFCVLFTTGGRQDGKDDQGLLGFLLRDIQKMVTDGMSSVCGFCGRSGATLVCGACPLRYHFPCGVRNGSTFAFHGSFDSRCSAHSVKQIDALDKYKSTIPFVEDMMCLCCFENCEDRVDVIQEWAEDRANEEEEAKVVFPSEFEEEDRLQGLLRDVSEELIRNLDGPRLVREFKLHSTLNDVVHDLCQEMGGDFCGRFDRLQSALSTVSHDVKQILGYQTKSGLEKMMTHSSLRTNPFYTAERRKAPSTSLPSNEPFTAVSSHPTDLCTEEKEISFTLKLEDCSDTEGSQAMECLAAPCCGRHFHRPCIQRMALASGKVHFRCPNCNNRDVFLTFMLHMGIYLPLRDAIWELGENSEFYDYQDMYHRYRCCHAKVCQSQKGREFFMIGTEFEIINCDVCGSEGVHIVCGGLDKSRPSYTCPNCSDALHRICLRDKALCRRFGATNHCQVRCKRLPSQVDFFQAKSYLVKAVGQRKYKIFVFKEKPQHVQLKRCHVVLKRLNHARVMKKCHVKLKRIHRVLNPFYAKSFVGSNERQESSHGQVKLNCGPLSCLGDDGNRISGRRLANGLIMPKIRSSSIVNQIKQS